MFVSPTQLPIFFKLDIYPRAIWYIHQSFFLLIQLYFWYNCNIMYDEHTNYNELLTDSVNLLSSGHLCI